MTSFLALLPAYYICDGAASLRPLPQAYAQRCAALYEPVKAQFRAEGDTSPAARLQSYTCFKAWEAANPEPVGHLKARARGNVTARLQQAK